MITRKSDRCDLTLELWTALRSLRDNELSGGQAGVGALRRLTAMMLLRRELVTLVDEGVERAPGAPLPKYLRCTTSDKGRSLLKDSGLYFPQTTRTVEAKAPTNDKP